ncbi:chromosome partitioning protein ParA, partial [Vibrio parahaemolyticus]
VGIPVDDSIDTSKTIRALTYNTKARTIAYLAYNHLQDGSVSTSLSAEKQYCE